MRQELIRLTGKEVKEYGIAKALSLNPDLIPEDASFLAEKQGTQAEMLYGSWDMIRDNVNYQPFYKVNHQVAIERVESLDREISDFKSEIKRLNAAVRNKDRDIKTHLKHLVPEKSITLTKELESNLKSCYKTIEGLKKREGSLEEKLNIVEWEKILTERKVKKLLDYLNTLVPENSLISSKCEEYYTKLMKIK